MDTYFHLSTDAQGDQLHAHEYKIEYKITAGKRYVRTRSCPCGRVVRELEYAHVAKRRRR